MFISKTKKHVKCDNCDFSWTVDTIAYALEIAEAHSVGSRDSDGYHQVAITPAPLFARAVGA